MYSQLKPTSEKLSADRLVSLSEYKWALSNGTCCRRCARTQHSAVAGHGTPRCHCWYLPKEAPELNPEASLKVKTKLNGKTLVDEGTAVATNEKIKTDMSFR